MAVGAVARGDIVIVHSLSLGLHGLFVVDAVNKTRVTIAPPDHAGKVEGGHKGNFPTVDKTDIFAVYKAASLSA
jgi:hypothetical protein